MHAVRRRRFRWVELFAGAAVAAALTACGPGPGASQAPIAQVEDRNATLRVGTVTAPATFDPHLAANPNQSNMYLSLVYDQLIGLSADRRPEPALAREWTMAPDGLSLDLRLRDDARFSDDGSVVDAGAVKANLERAKVVEGTKVAGVLETVTGVEVHSPADIRVRFSRPAHDFPLLLAADTRVSSIVNPAFFAASDLGRAPRGSGPYRLTSLAASGSVYRRVPGHWDPAAGRVDRLDIRVILDSTARLLAVQSGQLDLAVVVADSLVEAEAVAAGSSGRLRIHEVDSIVTSALLFNPTHGTVADGRLRRAISLAIDRKLLCDVGFGRAGTPTRQLFPPGVEGHVPALDAPAELEARPDAARAALKAAGIGPVRITTLNLIAASYRNMMQVISEQLRPLGVTFKVTDQLSAEAFANFARGNGDALLGSTNAALDPGSIVATNLASVRGFGVPDDLGPGVARAAGLAPGPERQAAYEEIGRRLVEEPYSVPLCTVQSLYLASNKVMGLERIRYGALTPVVDVRHVGKAR